MWIKLDQDIIKNKIFQNSILLKLFIYCLCRASLTEKDWRPKQGVKTVHLMPGDFITSRHTIAQDLGCSESSAYRWLKQLEKDGCIKIKVNSRFSHISVVNWEQYQNQSQNVNSKRNSQRTSSEQQANSQRTSSEHKHRDKDIRDKEIKNISPFGEGRFG